jgi:hypothetical protein
MTDTVGLETGMILNGALTVFTLKFFSNKTTQLTELYRRFTELNDVLKIRDGKLEQISRGMRRNIAFQFIVGCVFFTIFGNKLYRVFHQFRQAKFSIGGSILSSIQFLLLPQLP